MAEFVHLHTHSEYSLLDGLGRVPDLVAAAANQEMPALALTDHGTMFGAVEFFGKAKEAGVKPILGCEVYVSDRPLRERPGPDAENFHLLLLAENEAGYRNLIRLTSEAHLRGFYRKPRVDHALLEQFSDGLICLSGCASAEVPRLIQKGNLPAAEERADWYRQVFAGRYYLELQYHDLEIQQTTNQGVLHLSQRLGLPLVASNDVHYVYERQAATHEILLCIQTQSSMSDPKRMRLGSQQFYLKSAEQMAALFGDVPGALTNSLAIAERCNLELAFGRPHLPHVETPEGQTSEQYLRVLCEQGLTRRYPNVTEDIRQRLEYELHVIFGTGFIDYFLLVYDVISFARRSGIAVGPGRGSAAGSIVAYLLFLTNVDPMAHGLSFERFLNPERVSMPDMDLDFADDRREEVIQYVTERYGRDRVAQIITFGTIGPRAGVRDVGRCVGMSYDDVDRVAKLIPPMCNKIAKAREEVPELQQLYAGDDTIRHLLDTVEDMEGVARHASTHAAGVVISRDPLIEHVPLYKVPKNDQVTTQYAMGTLEKIGLLKMDFLGLRTLTVLERTRELIEQTTGQPFDLDAVPLEDARIYELLSTGETFGVFQVDGDGMRRLLRELNPTSFTHIVALIALYRPGPIEHIPEYVARRNGVHKVEYLHPALEEVLEETYGVVVYQDQVMRLAVRVAGYSMGEADLLRRAMAKKKPEELAKHKETFLARSEERGTSRQVAERLFEIIEPFAGYAFNKAHAAAYAVITCQTAYLKAHYPAEYMAGLLSAEKDNPEKVSDALNECRRIGITVLPPDVSRSEADFTLEDGNIRFGLGAIKHCGSGAIEAILTARRSGGPFKSLEDFCARVNWSTVSKKVMECLARCGALDSLGVERAKILANLDRLVAHGLQRHRLSAAGQASLFGEAHEPMLALQLAMADPASAEDKLAWELELLGTYVSPHPLTAVEGEIERAGAMMCSQIGPETSNQQVRIAGIIRGLRPFATKDGRPMASFQLCDLQESLDVVVFNRKYETLQSRIVDNFVVVVEGKLDTRESKARLLVDDILTVEEACERPMKSTPAARTERSQVGPVVAQSDPPASGAHAVQGMWRLTIEVQRGSDRSQDLDRVTQLYTMLQRYRGNDDVEIVVRTGQRCRSIPLPNPKVGYCEELRRALEPLLGTGALEVRPQRATA